MYNETHRAIFTCDRDGTEVTPDSIITDFRGDDWRFIGITRVPNGASTGRVYVDNGSYKTEFFPSVFNLTIVER